jgi:hypothetical protein
MREAELDMASRRHDYQQQQQQQQQQHEEQPPPPPYERPGQSHANRHQQEEQQQQQADDGRPCSEWRQQQHDVLQMQGIQGPAPQQVQQPVGCEPEVGPSADADAATAAELQRPSLSEVTPAVASPAALCVRISASSKGLELPCSSWQAWLPQVVLREAAVAKLGLRFLAQQQQGGEAMLLPAEGPVTVRALRSADGITIRWVGWRAAEGSSVVWWCAFVPADKRSFLLAGVACLSVCQRVHVQHASCQVQLYGHS